MRGRLCLPWRFGGHRRSESDLEPGFLEVYEGEHLLISGPARSGKSTLLLALDFEGFDFAGGQQTVRIDLNRDAGDHYPSIEGNVSTATADSDAAGSDAYTLAQTETFTTDDASAVAVDAYGLIA